MRKGVFLLVFAFLLMMYLLVATTSSLFVLQLTAAVQIMAGSAEVHPKGLTVWQPLQDGDYVKAGDTVRTGEESTVELRWVDGTRMRLAPHTTVEVRKCTFHQIEDTQTSLFYLRLGQIWVRLTKKLTTDSRFEVQTPTAVAGVRGTVFSVAVAPDGRTDISVYEGMVQVRAQRHEFLLRERQRLAVDRMKGTLGPQTLTPADLAAWQAQESLLLPYVQVDPVGENNVVHEPSIVLHGRAEANALVTVNGQPVKLNSRGRFKQPLTLAIGPNEITVMARDAQGRTTEICPVITYLPLRAAP